jgi:hypothetical protein
MKHLHVVFEDEEYRRLKKRKGKMNWHDYLLEKEAMKP